MPASDELAFLLDVDNTLIDNDFVKEDLDRQMAGFLSAEDEKRFWDVYEIVRHERDVVDFPHTLERFRSGQPDRPEYRQLEDLLSNYRFDRCLYPHAIETIHHLRQFGVAAVVSDGDQVFQPRKIAEAGIAEAVEGNVFIFVHKEESIAQVVERFPAKRYVMVDDKRRILAALKRDRPRLFYGVHVLQGHYASADREAMPPPDMEVARIADLRNLSAEDFLER